MKAFLPLLVMPTVLALALLSGCGTPGAPLPPSLDLPRPAEDLAASRKGAKVLLTWTPQRLTTDGAMVRRSRLGATRICRGTNAFPMVACPGVGEVPAGQTPIPRLAERALKAAFTDVLPAELQQQNPAGMAAYGVEAMNTRGRAGGLSNQVQVPLAPTLAPPEILSAQPTTEGVELSLPSRARGYDTGELTFTLRMYRRPETGPSTLVLETPYGPALEPKILDRGMEWEKTYFYRATVVTTVNRLKVSVEGDDSPEVKVFVHDIFPPATPAEVQAVYSGVGQKPFVDLTWAPDTEADLAGYNVYRREGDGQAAKIAKINDQLITVPAFRDQQVEPGRTYYYSVTAVDVRQNESPHSPETSERVP